MAGCTTYQYSLQRHIKACPAYYLGFILLLDLSVPLIVPCPAPTPAPPPLLKPRPFVPTSTPSPVWPSIVVSTVILVATSPSLLSTVANIWAPASPPAVMYPVFIIHRSIPDGPVPFSHTAPTPAAAAVPISTSVSLPVAPFRVSVSVPVLSMAFCWSDLLGYLCNILGVTRLPVWNLGPVDFDCIRAGDVARGDG